MGEFYEIVGLLVCLLFGLSIVCTYLLKNKYFALSFSSVGIFLLAIYLIVLWIKLERPPLRTLGETRLWYSFFISLVGLSIFWRRKYKWFFSYSLLFAILFLMLNYFMPEVFSKTLMPALQSNWFVPHVVVYMISYAFLGASAILGIKGLYDKYKNVYDNATLLLADDIVNIGFGFLNLGIIFGALWAKEAWGHYWTWDPKETWALITWLIYLFYIHFRINFPNKINRHLLILSLSFIVLLVSWFGINFIVSAQNSVHIYS